MNYRLSLVTHGHPRAAVDALVSHLHHVSPHPSSVFVHADGQASPQDVSEALRPLLPLDVPLVVACSGGQLLGFCESVRRTWAHTAAASEEWVYWLEHDFRCLRDIDLAEIAAVLEAHPHLGQMALYRQPVSDEEQRHGGYLKIPGRSYRRNLWKGSEADGHRFSRRWFDHLDYWTTNPSLFRTAFTRRFPWPADTFQCEGHFRFAIHAVDAGVRFGVWGDGELWVEHFGVRSGRGY